MAKRLDLEGEPWRSKIIDERLQTYATEAEKLLCKLPQLKVWAIQFKDQGYPDNALYVGMASKKEPPILNFKIIPSNLCVEFRFSQILARKHKDIFESAKWQNSSWRYIDLKTFGIDRAKLMIERYIEEIRPDFEAGKLRRGGKSFAEDIIRIALEQIFPGMVIRPNIRPDWLRSPLSNKCLQLDLLIEDKNIAIEVQGPQHFDEIYGKNTALKNNDLLKKNLCKKHNIKLIWMNWDGINILLKNDQPIEFLCKYLGTLLNNFLSSGHCFLWWKNIEEQHHE